MKAEVLSRATPKELSDDPVQEGFEELEKYLSSAHHHVFSRRSEEANEAPLGITDDPLHGGVDQLERTSKAVRLHSTQRS